MADKKKVYDDLIIINLYDVEFESLLDNRSLGTVQRKTYLNEQPKRSEVTKVRQE